MFYGNVLFILYFLQKSFSNTFEISMVFTYISMSYYVAKHGKWTESIYISAANLSHVLSWSSSCRQFLAVSMLLWTQEFIIQDLVKVSCDPLYWPETMHCLIYYRIMLNLLQIGHFIVCYVIIILPLPVFWNMKYLK